ncbi:MAG: RHS repeat-associated core domain-containing protein [Pyrinomonadaceae bacterium]
MDDSSTVLETYTYGASRERLLLDDGTNRKYYIWGGESVIATYGEKSSGTTLLHSRSFIYAGSRLLMTVSKATGGTEKQEFHHPDRLGTQLVTNGGTGTSFRQTTFPFGTKIAAETTGNTNQVFTSYDRSSGSGLDYAVNRTYSPGQSRFTQVDPIGMASASVGNPQSNNLYAYTQNMPTDFVDPSGLFLSTGFGSGYCYFVHQLIDDRMVLVAVHCANPNNNTGSGDDGYPGGDVNPLAQLGPCRNLKVPTFDELADKNPAALSLLQNTNGSGDLARSKYDAMSTYEKAVFLNTVSGASSAGVNLSDSQYVGPYRSTRPGNLPFGIVVTNASGNTDGRFASIGSAEVRTKPGISHIDIDLYNPLGLNFFKHQGEVRFNERHNRPTHPGDVSKQLAKRGVNSGVACTN